MSGKRYWGALKLRAPLCSQRCLVRRYGFPSQAHLAQTLRMALIRYFRISGYDFALFDLVYDVREVADVLFDNRFLD